MIVDNLKVNHKDSSAGFSSRGSCTFQYGFTSEKLGKAAFDRNMNFIFVKHFILLTDKMFLVHCKKIVTQIFCPPIYLLIHTHAA